MFAIVIITVICLVSVGLGYLAYYRGFTKSADDYFVAGSSLGYFVLIFSLLASFLSAFAMFGMSSFGYRSGFGALFVLTVNLVPLGFLWYFMHRKTLVLGRARKWRSMGAPFAERYGSSMRAIVPLVILVASIPYLVAQVKGIGVMVEAMSDGVIPYHAGIFFVPIFIVLYLMIGGMKGAAWVNTVQGVFFTLMVFVLFFAVMAKNGGFVPTMDIVFEKHPGFFELGAGGWSYMKAFGFAAAMCLGCVCFPQPYMHAYSSRSVKGFKVMILVFGAICVVVISMTTMIGIAGRALVPGLTGAEVEGVYGLAARVALPDALAALAVAGGFTAAMTTVNAMVFGNASNIANDLYKLIKPEADTKALVRFARVCVAVLMIVCVAIAWNSATPVAELSVIAFGIGAVTIFPLWGAYFWKRATRYGAIAGTLAGLGSNLVFLLLGLIKGPNVKAMVLAPQKPLYGLNGFLVSFIIAGVVFFVVSLLTPLGPTEKKSLAIFFHPSLDGGASAPEEK